jgi:ankyrin repeat protein
MSGDVAQVRKSLSRGADPNVVDSTAGMTPIAFACVEGHRKIVGLLVEAGADPNRGKSKPLYHAARTGHKRIVKKLLEAGADPNGRNPFETTALTAAAGNGHMEVVKILVNNGANIFHRTKENRRTAIDYAKEEGYAQIADWLDEQAEGNASK